MNLESANEPLRGGLKRGVGYTLLFAGWALWVGLVLAPPFLSHAGQGAVASGIYEFFGTICHQNPDRSFAIDGHALAVCHRCFGLYLGLGAGLLLLPLLPGVTRRLDRQPKLVLLFALPMFLDVLLFGYNVSASRFATGFVASFPVAYFCWMAAEQLAQGQIHKQVTEGAGPEVADRPS